MTTRLQNSITAGDTLNFLVSSSTYPAPTWTLSYRLVPRVATLDPIQFDSVAEGADHRIAVLPNDSSAWTAGDYQWFAYFGDGTNRYTVDQGSVTVRGDPAQVEPGYDARSHARIVLDAINAVIERRASMDQMEYTINNRMLKRTPIADLLMLQSEYRIQVAAEDAATAGRVKTRRSYVRYFRAV